jgi:hypothetical protein
MKSIYMDIVKYNMLLTSELIKIMKILEENDIKAIAFKGPTLAQLAYGDVTLRQYMDLDILINYVELEKMNNILKDINYFPENNLIDKKLRIQILKDMSYFNKEKNINLEIHWRLFSFIKDNRFNYELNFLNFNNVKLLNFDINFYIAYLAIHGSRHLWERIEWIVDINNLINKYNNEIDFKKIYKFATSYDNNKSIDLAFCLCYKLFDNIYVNNTYDNEILILFNKVTQFRDSEKKISKFEIFIFHNKLFTSKSSKLKHLFKLLDINERDLNFVHLKYKFLYYFYKPFRLLKVMYESIF